MLKNLGSSADYDRYARVGLAQWDALFLLRVRQLLTLLPSNSTLVDVGAGTGVLTRRIARIADVGSTIYLVEPDRSMLDQGTNFRASNSGDSRIKAIHGLAHNLPFEDSSIHLITCRATLHHIDDKLGALREFYRVLAPGGYAIIQDMRRDPGVIAFERFCRLRVSAGYPATNLSEKLSLMEIARLVEESGIKHLCKITVPSEGAASLGYEILLEKPR